MAGRDCLYLAGPLWGAAKHERDTAVFDSQKTLTKVTIAISSISIAEGKYVAALQGDKIVILDYSTGSRYTID